MISTLNHDDGANQYILKTNVKKSKSKLSIHPNSESKKSDSKLNFKKKNLDGVLSIDLKGNKKN